MLPSNFTARAVKLPEGVVRGWLLICIFLTR
jgi:hypothetical protein